MCCLSFYFKQAALARWTAAFQAALLVVALIPAAQAKDGPPRRATAPAPACAADVGKGPDYSGRDLTNHNFSADPPGSLVGANFAKANLSGAIFAGQDLTNVSFVGANLGPARGPVDFTSAKLTNTCFIGANLDQTDFTYANIACADFSGSSLMKAAFGPMQNMRQINACRAKFVGATLDVHLITVDYSGKSNWSKSDFTNANFPNLSPDNFNLRGQDISGAILAGDSFIGIDMTGANLTNVDFTNAVLTKARLDNATVNGAKFYSAQASSASFRCLQAYGSGAARLLPDNSPCPKAPASSNPGSGADFTFASLRDGDFTAATLDHATFGGANLNSATLVNASLAQANLQSTQTPVGPSGVAHVQFAVFTNADFSSALLAQTDFSGGNLVGANFNGTTLSGVNFANAVMSGASFNSGSLQSVNFSGANLQSATFEGVNIQAPGGGGFGANFSCGQLGGADFKDAKVSATNFGNAVMPAASDCCPAKDKGGQPWCGVVNATQRVYGPVTFPILASPSTCPNGDTGQCSGAQWRISANWQTRGCNVDQEMQTLWSKPNCGGTPGDIVVFKDQALKSCILATLPGQTEVLRATAQQIAQVNCPGRGIGDLTGLEAFIALTKLDLSGNALKIFNLAFVAGGQSVPSRLASLNVSDNQLTTLDLTNHPQLVSLTVANNALGSVLLNANAALIVLDVSHNQLTGFNLPIQTMLSYADLSYNRLTNVLNSFSSDLSALTGLSYLDLSHNALTTIGSAKSLAWNKQSGGGGALQSLFLACNAGFRCGDLEIYDGAKYPAAATSQCSVYSTSTSTWTPLANPACPVN